MTAPPDPHTTGPDHHDTQALLHLAWVEQHGGTVHEATALRRVAMAQAHATLAVSLRMAQRDRGLQVAAAVAEQTLVEGIAYGTFGRGPVADDIIEAVPLTEQDCDAPGVHGPHGWTDEAGRGWWCSGLAIGG